MSDFFLFFIQIIKFLIGGIIAASPILLAIYLATRPSVVNRQNLEKYIDYSTGLEIIKRRYGVKLGKIPYLNRLLFHKLQLDAFPFFDVSFSVYIEEVEYLTQLEEGKEWFSKIKKGQKRLFLRRSKTVGLTDPFYVISQVLRERAKGKIDDEIKKETKETVNNTTTKVKITLSNNLDLTIRNYEVPFSIPTLKGLKVLGVQKVNAGRQAIQFRLEDFGIRLDIPLSKIPVVQNEQLSSQKGMGFTAYVDLLPGKTEIEFQYEKE